MSPQVAFALIWLGFAAYLGVLAAAPWLSPRIVWATICGALLAFAVAPVLLSHDVYSYVAYARLGVVHGLDPYLHAPLAAPADPIYPRVEWTEATSAYGPLFTLATYPLAWLPIGGAVAALKVTAALAVGALALLVARIAAARGIHPVGAAAFVALNPLILVHVVGGAHNDGLAMLLAVAAVAALLAAREALSGAARVAAVAIKASTAVLAPFVLLAAARPKPPWLRDQHRRRGDLPPYKGVNSPPGGAWRLMLGGFAAAGLVALAGWVAFGWDWTSAFGLAGENQDRTSYMSIPIAFARLSGLDPGAVRAAALVIYALAFAGLLLWTWRGADWVRAAGWASLGLLHATSWLLPWYLIWALPLAALSRDRPLQLLTLALTAYQLGARIPL